ncbi:MAG: hypothetical protein J6S14_08925 [Clostridia bacterium]|nr:hypothetical protein [Clostridia bacterium]
MTLVQSIDKIVEWLNESICPQIFFKLPNDRHNDPEYNVEFVHPSAFPLYVPGKDRLPPSVPAPIPSVCAQLMEGSDDLLAKKRQLQIRLCLACWNPGLHSDEIFHPTPTKAAQVGYIYHTANDGAAQSYTRNMDGWRDAFNFADLVLRELENTEYIAGHRLVKESGIKYGLFTEEGNIWDYYPYWHNWITFTLECGVVRRVPEEYKEFL